MWLLFGRKFDNTFLHLLLLSHHLFINSFIPFYTHIPTFQLYLTLWNPMDCSPPGSSVHGIFQATILKWVAMPSSRGSSWPRDWIQVSYVSCISRQVLYHWHHLGLAPTYSLISYLDAFLLQRRSWLKSKLFLQFKSVPLLSSMPCPPFYPLLLANEHPGSEKEAPPLSSLPLCF